MKLESLGHACFLITNDQGKKLMCDPFDGHLGYPVPKRAADLVTTSHGHADHNYVAELPAGYQLIDTKDRVEKDGFVIYGVESCHDDKLGSLRGMNIIYVIEADGLRFAHLGDLGHILTVDQLAQIGDVDVLMIPVGGYYTIDAQAAAAVVAAVKPKVVIPMHYRTAEGGNDKIAPVDGFLALMGDDEIREYDYLDLSVEGIDALRGVAVLTRV